jgi:hypothetical protein
MPLVAANYERHTKHMNVERGQKAAVHLYNCTLHLFKDQPEDGPTFGPKHVAGIVILYNKI